ncbi:hypothetical protein BV22DRAFT_802710 [Leucogyrophana mollusca]|uniref:Uncharacterized protein n=1 Tax=Leucogyrophana mollusca TaxID=85980 RepID=A0ACB8B433_9AGAM|nr:hypothetical protein BV22DRAFT_802710 [Leucogyrophana mollusca]
MSITCCDNTSTYPVSTTQPNGALLRPSIESEIIAAISGMAAVIGTPSTPQMQTSTASVANLVGHTSSISSSYFSSPPIPPTPPSSYDLSSSATLFSTSTLSRSPPQSTPPSATSTPLTASPPSTASPPYISPTSPTLSSTPHSDVGIIAGAAAGGLAILASVILILCFRRRKCKRSTGKDLDAPPRTFTLSQSEVASDRAEDHSPLPVMSEMASDPGPQELPTYAPPQQTYGHLMTDEKVDSTNDLQAGNVERMLSHEDSGVAGDEDGPGSPGGSSRGSVSTASAPPSYASEEWLLMNQ